MKKNSVRYSKPTGIILTLLVLGCFLVTATSLQAQAGRIAGKVVEAGTKAALPGANVSIVGTNLGAAADRQGYFIISRVPAGTYEVSVSYIGYETGSSSQVQVVSNEVTSVDFELQYTAIEVSEVTVTAARLSHQQATALHAQREAVSIKSIVASDLIGTFPDINASETLARVPAIAITRDHGEGRFAIVRGIRPEYNSTTINGERVPSAEKEVRTVALDVVPADLIETIEVSKALTADMDGDAIGGNINLIMKDAPDRRILNVLTAYGLNGREGVPDRKNDRRNVTRLNVLTGDSFEDGKFGYIISGSYYDTFLKTDNEEYRFKFKDAGDEALSDGTSRWDTRDYELNRTRFGFNGSLLFKPSLGHKFYFRGFFSRFSDQEFRHRIQRRYDKGRISRDLKDRLEQQTIQNYTIGGDHIFAHGAQLDYHYAYTRNREDRPDEYNLTYRLKFDDFEKTRTVAEVANTEFGGFMGPQDPLGYSFNETEIQTLDIRDRDHVVAANLLLPFNKDKVHGNVKFGAKARFKVRTSELFGLIIEPGENDFYLEGGINTTEFPPQATDFRPPEEVIAFDQIADDPGEASINYEADEDVLAGYVQSQLWFGDKLMVLPGVRIEKTKTSNRSLAGRDESRDKTKADYTDILPSFHVRYKTTENSNVRFAFSRAISRPNYFDLVPSNFVDDDERILGNPELDPVRATNLDLLYEFFDTRFAGVISAGVFYKKLKNPIEIFESDPGPDETNEDVEKIIEPRNSDGDATIKGFEVGLQKSLSFIGLRGFGIIANYTYVDGELELTQADFTRPLVGQSKHLINLALNYENPKVGFSGQIAWKFKGEQLEASGEGNADDPFEADYKRLDLTINQRVISGITFFLEGRNLTNEPLRFFVKNPVTGRTQDLQVEFYGRSLLTGFKLNL